ncbi:MAG: hypothetical protein O3A25_15460 [Acidobacteria bacterium]|nr:hypothetical protein [Acidobacteriota bacterium]
MGRDFDSGCDEPANGRQRVPRREIGLGDGRDIESASARFADGHSLNGFDRSRNVASLYSCPLVTGEYGKRASVAGRHQSGTGRAIQFGDDRERFSPEKLRLRRKV